MGLFSKLFKPAPPPDWAKAFDSAGFDTFVNEVQTFLNGRGTPVDDSQVRSGSVVLQTPAGAEREWILWEAASRCANSPKEEWPSIFDAELEGDPAVPPEYLHGDKAEDLEQDDHARVTLDARFEDGGPRLRIQLFSSSSPASVLLSDLSNCISRKVAGDLVAVLVYDLVAFETTVSREVLARWGKSEDELFEVALANTLGEPFETMSLEGLGQEVVMLVGNGPYVAARVFGLGRTSPLESDRGVLVAVPNWHMVLMTPVLGQPTREALPRLLELVEKSFAQADSLCTQLFWWRQGQLHPLTPELQAELG